MEQVIIGGWYNTPHKTTTEYNGISCGYNWNADPEVCSQVVSTAGTLKNLRIELDGMPGTGTYVFTLHRRVGVGAWGNTALTCTVAADGTIASDTVNKVAVAAGDVICLQCNPDNPDNARYARWTMMFEGDTAKESLLLTHGNVLATSDTLFQVSGGQNSTGTENDIRQVCPTNGVIRNLFVQLGVDPGDAPDGHTFTLRVNGVDSDDDGNPLQVAIVANSRVGNDTTHEISVSAGDILTLSAVRVNTPVATEVAVGMTFVAATDGESIIMGGGQENLDDTLTEYTYLSRDYVAWPTVTEAQAYQLAQECTLKKLYVLLSGDPGGTDYYTFTVRLEGASPDGGLVVEIAGGSTTGNDTTNSIAVSDGEVVNLMVDPTDTPAVVDAYWGLVCSIVGADPQLVTPPTLALTITTYAPTVSTPILVTPPTLALNLTAYAPSVAIDVKVTPSTLALILTSYAPTAEIFSYYSATAPLTVMAQRADSMPGELVVTLSLAGLFNMWSEQEATVAYSPDSSNTDTVKTILDAIASATLTCFNTYPSHTITYDSGYDDSIINAYTPKAAFSIAKGESRLSAFKKAMSFIKCKARVGNDSGIAIIHIFQPTITGASYDSEYNDAYGDYHNFFNKSVRKRLVIPNKVVVMNHPDHDDSYTGNATDNPSYAALGKKYYTETVYLSPASNAECTRIAIAKMQNYQLAAEKGHGFAPMNVGQEVLDYVKITDSRAGDTRVGNVGFLQRNYRPGEFTFEFRFGTMFLAGLAGTPPPSTISTITTTATGKISTQALADAILNLYDIVNTLRSERIFLFSLDDVKDGVGYSKVKATDITAGHILLSEVTGSLDDITDGDAEGYSKILTTDISSGHIKLSSVTQSVEYRTVTDTEKGTWNGKIITFFEDEPPTAEGIGDFWVDTNDKNKLSRWSGEAWVTVRDTDIAQAITNAATAQSTADGKIVTFYQLTVPIATDAGDLWVDISDKNKLYRATNKGDNAVEEGEWELVRDTDIVQALTNAASAQTTADSKPDDMDELGEGVEYQRVLATDISSGHIKLTSDTAVDGEWYDQSGVEIDATHGINIYGTANALTTRATKDGDIQCYVGADGVIYAGAGAVALDASGITVTGQLLTFKRGESVRGYIFASTGADLMNIYGVGADIYLLPGTGKVILVGSDVNPATDDARDLGSGDYRYNQGYIRRVYADYRMQIPVGENMYG